MKKSLRISCVCINCFAHRLRFEKQRFGDKLLYFAIPESSVSSGEKRTISAASSASSTITSANPTSSSSSSAGRATSSVKPAPSSPKSTKGQKASSNQKKILVAYFSWSGNTRQIANMIHNKIGGDIFEIKTKMPYSSDYNTDVNQAQQEQKQNARPFLRPALRT